MFWEEEEEETCWGKILLTCFNYWQEEGSDVPWPADPPKEEDHREAQAVPAHDHRHLHHHGPAGDRGTYIQHIQIIKVANTFDVLCRSRSESFLFLSDFTVQSRLFLCSTLTALNKEFETNDEKILSLSRRRKEPEPTEISLSPQHCVSNQIFIFLCQQIKILTCIIIIIISYDKKIWNKYICWLLLNTCWPTGGRDRSWE